MDEDESAAAAAAAAAAECHYRAGRFQHAIIELVKCEKLAGSRLTGSWGIDGRRHGGDVDETKHEGIDDAENDHNGGGGEAIVVATYGNDESIPSFSPSSSKSSTGRRSGGEEEDGSSHRRRNRMSRRRAELIALPRLAHRADAAMCRFRSAIIAPSSSSSSSSSSAARGESPSSSSGGMPYDASSLNRLWGEAIESNGTYRRALAGAARSLVQSAAISRDRWKRRSVAVVVSAGAEGERRRTKGEGGEGEDESDGGYYSIRRLRDTMIDVVLAMLMAGIAASHLRMHRLEANNECRDGCVAHDEGIADSPWTVLENAALSAADLVLAKRAWLMDHNDNNVGMKDGAASKLIIGGADFKSVDALETSLIVLNEEMTSLQAADSGPRLSVSNEIIERWNVVMHSFRIALKVTGLATGRLILPKVTPSTSSSAEEVGEEERKKRKNEETDEIRGVPLKRDLANSKKRRKFEARGDDAKGGGTIASRTDAWNVKYSHSSLTLLSRDRLVDAISFQLAAVSYPCSKRPLIASRDACFEEAVSWEDRACDLFLDSSDDDKRNCDGEGTSSVTVSEGCAGYAWKIRNCLQGLEIAPDNVCHSDGDVLGRDADHVKRRKRVELLATSSTSRFACDLLGCLRFRDGDTSSALEALQSSLESLGQHDSVMGGNGLYDNDETMDDRVAEWRTVANMALCLASMGESRAPLELLLHMWETSPMGIRNSTSNVVCRPVALLLSCTTFETEYTSSKLHLRRCARLRLLWMLYGAASIARDRSTCLILTEKMLGMQDNDDTHDVRDAKDHCDVARIFALLQCRRASVAQDAIHDLLPKLVSIESQASLSSSFSRYLLRGIAELYGADALLFNESCAKVFDDENPWECTQRAVNSLGIITGIISATHINNARSKASLAELHITILNDHGIALMTKGDSVGALRCFREAATRATKSGANDCPSWLLLPTHFNLSLLLLRDGRVNEAVSHWLCARGHYDTWQKALRGDNDALLRVKNLSVVAVNRHGLLIAKRSMTKHADMMWDHSNAVEWVPPVVEGDNLMLDSTRIDGVDALQVYALDVLLSKHASISAEKKSSSLFWRSAGNVSY